MALEYAHGAIQWLAADAATTTYTVSGLSFQPKALRFSWCGLQAGSGEATSASVNLQRGVGFASSTSARRSVDSFDQDAAVTAVCGLVARDDAIACTTDGAAGSTGMLDLNAINSDGFECIVDDAAPQDLTVFWEAWGGSDITNVTVGDIAEPAATGTQDYTATGFVTPSTGDQIVMLGGCHSTAALNTAAAIDNGFMIGYASGTGVTENIVLLGAADDGNTVMATRSYGRSNQCLAMAAGASNPGSRAILSAFGTDLFTLNWATRATTDRRYVYMAIKGGNWAVGEYTINGGTINSTATVSGLTFAPKGVSLIGRRATENVQDGVGTHDEMGWGCGSSASSRRAMAMRDENATASSVCEIGTIIEYTSILCFVDRTGTELSTYDINAMNSDGFEIIVDKTGGVVSEWQGYCAFGDAPVVAPESIIQRIQHTEYGFWWF